MSDPVNHPHLTVVLRGSKRYSSYIEYHETIKDAALSAYWGQEDNTFFPDTIEDKGEIVWMSPLFAGDKYPTLVALAGMEEES